MRDHRVEDAPARVVLVAWLAGRGGEHRVVEPRPAAGGLVRGELVAEDREHRDFAQAGVGLRVADVQAALGEVDVAPGSLMTSPGRRG